MKEWEIQRLVFCHHTFQSDFVRSANTSGDVLRLLLRKRIITDLEKKELFSLPPQKRNLRITRIMMNKKLFNLQPLIEAMRAVPENEALLNLLQTKIERKKAQLQNPKPKYKEKMNDEMKNLRDRIATELLPLAVGEDKAAVIQSEQRNCGDYANMADENLTTVIKHLESKKDCLHGLCMKRQENYKNKTKKFYELKIKKMKADLDTRVDEYKRKIAEQDEEMQALQRRNEELETKIKQRISQGFDRLQEKLQEVDLNRTTNPSETVPEEEEGRMTHANSCTNIAMNFYFNDNATTGDLIINQATTSG